MVSDHAEQFQNVTAAELCPVVVATMWVNSASLQGQQSPEDSLTEAKDNSTERAEKEGLPLLCGFGFVWFCLLFLNKH